MGTEIYNRNNMYIKRYWAGKDKGTLFVFYMDEIVMTQKELAEFISKLSQHLIV